MNRRDLAELLLLGAIWGASFLFLRIAVPAFGAVPLVEMRVAIAAAVLLVILRARGRTGALKGRWKSLTVVAALNTAIPFSLFAFATLSVSAGFAAVLNSTVPLWGAAVGLGWFGERLSRERAIGLAVGFAGVVLLVSRDLSLAGRPLAIAAGLGAAILYGIAAHVSRRQLKGVDTLAVAAGTTLASSLILLVPAIASWPAGPIGPTAWWCAIALGVACTALAYVLFFRLIERVGATRAMSVAYLIPLFGILWGRLFLDEPITWNMALGCGAILGGVALASRQPAAKAAT